MMRNNINSLSKQSNNIYVVEQWIVIYFVLGMFFLYDNLFVLSYVISIFLQIYTIFYLYKNKLLLTKTVKIYVWSLIFIFLVTMSFIWKNVEIIKIVNRIGPMVSIFGLIILSTLKLNIIKIMKKIVDVYCFFVLFVDIDAIIFRLTGNAIWRPISYLSYRYAGFFKDPNMMSFFSASILFLLLTLGEYKGKKNIFKMVCLIINIYIAGSLATFIIIGVAYAIPIFVKTKNLLKKQMLILVIYFFFIFLFSLYSYEISEIMIDILENIYGDLISARIKYASFVARIDAQMIAIDIFSKDIWGQGPLQMVIQLGRDSHNSYIGMMFEQGIFGILVILLSVKCVNKREMYNIWIDRMGYFIMLSALILSVHFTVVYSIYILIIHRFNAEDWSVIEVNNCSI